jgi:hypothetical protein
MEDSERGGQPQEPHNLLLGRAEPIPAPATDVQPNEARSLGVASAASREIMNVGVLDLSAMETPEALDNVRRIANVGVILAPRPLLQKLSQIPMVNVGTTIPIPAGARIRAFTGATVLGGEALANEGGDPNQVLLVTGALAITSPVRTVGYAEFIVSGTLIAPEGSEAGLGVGLTRMTGELSYYPYTEGSNVRVRTGFQRMSGADLANPAGQETDILIVLDTLSVSGPVERLGYQHIVVTGMLVAPPGSEAAFSGRVTTLGGEVVFTSARPRVLKGRDELSQAFFEYLDEPVLLIISGRCTFADDVTPEILKQKVGGIILTGRITAPRAIVPLIQVLTLAKTGRISASDEDQDRDRGRSRG